MIAPEQLAVSGTESGHQKAFMCWCSINKIDFIFAIPNGGFRDKREAANLVAEGARKGVLDLFCAKAKRDWNGLFIEMKKPDRRKHSQGGLSDEQVIWIMDLTLNGYKCEVCYSWEEAKDKFLKYMEG